MFLIIATVIILIAALCAVPLVDAVGDALGRHEWTDAMLSSAFLLLLLSFAGFGTYVCLAYHLDTLAGVS